MSTRPKKYVEFPVPQVGDVWLWDNREHCLLLGPSPSGASYGDRRQRFVFSSLVLETGEVEDACPQHMIDESWKKVL